MYCFNVLHDIFNLTDMMRFALIFMLLICGFSVGADFLTYDRQSCEENTPQLSVSSNVQHDQDRKPAPCADESCNFHRCHFGHCALIVVSTTTSSLAPIQLYPRGESDAPPASVYLAPLTRPPAV